MSAMERTELKMAVIAEQLGLSWAGEWPGMYSACFHSVVNTVMTRVSFAESNNLLLPAKNCLMGRSFPLSSAARLFALSYKTVI